MADSHSPIVVIGLGRFGASLAQHLVARGIRVLCVDSDMEAVQAHAETLPQVVRADATDAETLRQLGIDAGWRAVVAIGDLQQSLVTTTVLRELGVDEIWAKAQSERHALILERLGATHVVQPEAELGSRVSHLLVGHMLDYLPVDEDFSVAKTSVPDYAAGQPLGSSQIRERHGVRVIAVKRSGGEMLEGEPETIPLLGDTLVVWGRTDLVERFSELT